MSGLAELSGKVAVVTGGASGIGKGIAGQLAAEGMRVIIADIEQGALDKAAGEIGAIGVPTDVSDVGSVRALARAARELYGTVHVVCNNAGLRDVDIQLEDNPDHRWIDPEEAGAVVVRAIKRGDLYALTHPDWYPRVESRHQAIAAAFRQQAAEL